MMIKRFKTGLIALGAIAALALGGSAVAGAAQSQPHVNGIASQESTAPENSATDPDNVQSTTAPDPAPAASTANAKGAQGNDARQATPEPGGQAEQPGQESSEAPDQESGSEVPGSDGPA